MSSDKIWRKQSQFRFQPKRRWLTGWRIGWWTGRQLKEIVLGKNYWNDIQQEELREKSPIFWSLFLSSISSEENPCGSGNEVTCTCDDGSSYTPRLIMMVLTRTSLDVVCLSLVASSWCVCFSWEASPCWTDFSHIVKTAFDPVFYTIM